MPESEKRARSRATRPRPPQQRPTSPGTDLLDALRDGVDSPTSGPLLGAVGPLLSVAVRIDDELGALATDGYVVQSPLASGVPLLVGDDDPMPPPAPSSRPCASSSRTARTDPVPRGSERADHGALAGVSDLRGAGNRSS